MNIIFVLLISISLFASEIDIDIDAGFKFDNNPYSISDKEENHPIGVVSDLVSFYSLDAETRIAKLGKFSVKPSFVLSAENYFDNTGRNNIKLRPKILFIKHAYWITAYYQYMPQKSIRPLKDSDDNYEWKFPKYTNNLFRLRSGLEFIDNTWAEVSLKYQLKYFDENFMEYDERQYGLFGYLRYNKELYLKAGYGFDIADCRGYDVQGENAATSDDSDASYDEDSFLLSVGYNFGKFDIRLSSFMYMRYYTSKKPDDTYHYTRKDTYNSFDIDFRYDFDDFYIKLGGKYMTRSIESEIFEELSDLRSYNRIMIDIEAGYDGLSLKY
ncbi:MAG: hypothetical protein ACLFSQ_11560 [Candidatus Zixiibacteriota bacterium]